MKKLTDEDLKRIINKALIEESWYGDAWNTVKSTYKKGVDIAKKAYNQKFSKPDIYTTTKDKLKYCTSAISVTASDAGGPSILKPVLSYLNRWTIVFKSKSDFLNKMKQLKEQRKKFNCDTVANKFIFEAHGDGKKMWLEGSEPRGGVNLYDREILSSIKPFIGPSSTVIFKSCYMGEYLRYLKLTSEFLNCKVIASKGVWAQSPFFEFYGFSWNSAFECKPSPKISDLKTKTKIEYTDYDYLKKLFKRKIYFYSVGYGDSTTDDLYVNVVTDIMKKSLNLNFNVPNNYQINPNGKIFNDLAKRKINSLTYFIRTFSESEMPLLILKTSEKTAKAYFYDFKNPALYSFDINETDDVYSVSTKMEHAKKIFTPSNKEFTGKFYYAKGDMGTWEYKDGKAVKFNMNKSELTNKDTAEVEVSKNLINSKACSSLGKIIQF